MKLSVIVPVYQVEAYLPACLDSLLEQGMSDLDYEIICVDDGSTDRSGKIAEEYAGRYRQLVVIHQKNKGLSAARNTGIRAAGGEYIYFIDSDDLLEKNVLGSMYKLAVENNLDQLLFDFQRFKDGTETPSFGRSVDPDKLILFRDPQKMRRHKNVPEWRIAWNYLVRRSVLQEYELTFHEGVLFEDAEFNFWLDRCVLSCGYLNQKLYYYRQRNGSILKTFMNDENFPRYIYGRLKLATHYKTLLQECQAGKLPRLRVPVTSEELEYKEIDEVQGILNFLMAKGNRELFQQTLTELREQGLYPYPLRWRRLLRRVPLKKFLINVVSFLYPVQRYLKFCISIRMRLR